MIHSGARPAPVAAGVRHIALQEGLRISLDAGAYAPRTLFAMTAACSAMLRGKPVRCTGFLPGVSLLAHVMPRDDGDLSALVGTLWAQSQFHIARWVDMVEQFPRVAIPANGAGITLGLDRLVALDEGAMQIMVRPAGWQGAAATGATAGT